MRKYILGLLIVITASVLSGCGYQLTTANLDKIVSEALNDEGLNKYLESITYEQTDSYDPEEDNYAYYYYDIIATLDDSYDSLAPKEQNEFIEKIAKVVEKNSGTPQGINGEGEFFCGEEITCEFGNIILNTSKHVYHSNYNLPGLTFYLHKDDLDKDWDEQNIIYDPTSKDGKYVDPTSGREPDDNSETSEKMNETALSQEFLEYNRKYYTAYKNSLDLIGSNFELIYEGYYSSDLIDDLIVWTTEFNELLDVYEQNSNPVNENDKNLYTITNQMITQQRAANEQIIKGLKNGDNQSLKLAGQYLETVTNLYLEGYSIIE
ncbi:hypothetical protein [Bacillus sp. JJ1562]|uniref:hypothetical protein n=1 Tax=Bacillus sp. JJ1562 TaxID=3122960 RepID=UPI003001B171